MQRILSADSTKPVQDSKTAKKHFEKEAHEAVMNDRVKSDTTSATNGTLELAGYRPEDENAVDSHMSFHTIDVLSSGGNEVGRLTPVNKQSKTAEVIPAHAEKRQRPGKLDITAAKDASKRDVELVMSSVDHVTPATPTKSVRNNVAGISQPGTPGTAVSQSSASPLHRQAPPRTIRVVQTPKAETPSQPPPLPTTSTLVGIMNHRLSRQPSFGSLYQPDTPANETVSDNMSLTSTSVSRPGSPPIGKVGSAPIRFNTKSQQKKERQARARQIEESRQTEESTASTTVLDEPVQAPIVGRKKKTKKSKLQVSADSLSMGSGPPSPHQLDEKAQEDTGPILITGLRDGSTVASSAKKAKHGVSENSMNKDTPEIIPESPTDLMDKSRKNQLSAAAIFAELQKAGELVSSALDLFRNVPGINHRFDLNDSDLAEKDKVPPISDAQHRLLDQGRSICLKLTTNKYAVVLPNRRVLRGFSLEQAERYLDLRQQTLEVTSPAHFRSSRYNMERWLNLGLVGGCNSNGESAGTSALSIGDDTIVHREMTQLFTDSFSNISPRDKQVDAPLPNFWESDTAASNTSIGGAANRQPCITTHEAERALAAARKETEALEKRLNGLLKKNRKLFMNSH